MNKLLNLLFAATIVCTVAVAPEPIAAQRQGAGAPPPEVGTFGALRWRSVGPPRGGRSIAATGSVARPFEYYMGATGGGLWKTTDGGASWRPVTDGQIHSSSVGP